MGFTARPVVGGVFLQLLYDKGVWSKWASRDMTKAASWAPMPKLPIVTEVVKTAATEPANWSYTFTKPEDNWSSANFDVSPWSTGKSGFGTEGTPNATVHTKWSTPDIWLTREIDVSKELIPQLQWLVHHDEDTEIYINGQLAAKFSGYSVQYDLRPISTEARKLFKPGRNRIAVHCHQTSGGQFIDVGLATVN